MNLKPYSTGIPYLAYNLPKIKRTVSELSSLKLISSKAQVLKNFGFKHSYAVESSKEFDDLVIQTAQDLLYKSKINTKKIDTLFLYSGLKNSITDIKPENNLFQFIYPVSRIQHELGLSHVHSLGVTQQGCSGLLTTAYHATRLLQSSDKKHIMIVSADMLPLNSNREIMYNIMSDAISGIILEKDSTTNQLLFFYQQAHPYYWNTPKVDQELLASYFPMSKRTIEDCLKQAQLTIDDITWFIPHNVSLRSWKILASLLQIPEEKIWVNNIQRIGHTISSDHIINIFDMQKQKKLKKGDVLFLFTFGFGASWTCMILKH